MRMPQELMGGRKEPPKRMDGNGGRESDLESRQTDKTLGILGGTFDPVHNGHLGLAGQVKERFRLDRILFVPARVSPHKLDQDGTPAHHRFEMLRLALAPHPDYGISEVEIHRSGPSYTVDTIDLLKAEAPEKELHLIMGQDTFESIATWKDTLRLLTLCHIIVARRRTGSHKDFVENMKLCIEKLGVPHTLQYQEENVLSFLNRASHTAIRFFDLPLMDVSSSEIRERIARKEQTKNLLPPKVENYIIENQLYRAQCQP